MGAVSDVKGKYPSYGEIIVEFLVHVTRGPALMTALAYAVHAPFVSFTAWLGSFGLDEAMVFAACAWLTHFVLYVLCGGLAYYLDMTGTLQQYKLYRTEAMTNPPSRYRQMWKEAILGMIVTPPLTYMLYTYFDLGNNIFAIKNHEALGEPQWVFATLSFAKFFNSFMFYWAHRLFHHDALYARFHKQHHSFVGTIAWSAEFADPIEQVFANFGPTLVGVTLFHPHPLLFHLWLGVRLHQTYESHSGYAFHNSFLHKIGLTYSDETAFHDFHHTVNKGNYSMVWIDALFGTMDPWVEGGGVEGYIKKGEEAKRVAKKSE